jgi:hypothetical protein
VDCNPIRRRIALLIGTLLWVAAANSAVPLAGQIDFQIIHPMHGPLPAKPAYFTIRTQEQWLEWWNAEVILPADLQAPDAHPQSTTTRPPPPEIDFEHFIALIASGGVKRGNQSIAFIAVFRSPAGITAAVAELSRKGRCSISTAVSIPVAIVLIPRTDEPIKFNVFPAASECSDLKSLDEHLP